MTDRDALLLTARPYSLPWQDPPSTLHPNTLSTRNPINQPKAITSTTLTISWSIPLTICTAIHSMSDFEHQHLAIMSFHPAYCRSMPLLLRVQAG
mmetsp:Transcript_3519/g.5004  ORF Transcript_3519/g.5004 Transcript_3519/m.5004 type:complete len:95 (+) Transcript_3519:528-812(+)